MFLHASIQWYYSIIGVFALCGLLLLTQKSKADPLLNTDDASITAAHHCQLETAYTRSQGQVWSAQMTPACNLNENLEISLGYHAIQNVNNDAHGFSVHAKTVLKPMENDWGVASSLMLSHDHQFDRSSDLDWFFNVPVSFRFLDQSLGIDTNVGYQYAHDHAHLMRWGIASSYNLTERLSLSAEVYNQDRQAPFFQTAISYSLIPNILTLETSFGDRLHAFRQRWFGLGLSFTPAS